MQCPACAAEVAEQLEFCQECGEPIVAPDDAAPSDIDTDTDTDTAEATDTAEIVETSRTDETAEITDTAEITETAAPTDEVVGLPPPVAPTEQAPTPEPAPTITEQLPMVGPPPTITEQYPIVEVPAPPVSSVFDGSGDIAQFPEAREPFRLRVMFLLSIFGAAAMLMTIVANVIDIRTSRPTAGIVTGSRLLDDLGSNLALAGFVGAAVLVIGSLLSCFGLRWGAGLAGGAGLAILGWAGLSIGLAELPIAVAESVTRTSTAPEPFTLRVTRDIGWWLIVGLGAIGLIVFLASLRWIGTGRRVALNPMIAALTAVAVVVLGFGPMVPVGSASFADNFRSTDPLGDLPVAFYAGRLGQLGLIVVAGVVGMLIVRSYGLGLAAGGLSVSVWLWVSSYSEIGPRPVGIADRNPGSESTVPHAVTTVGLVASLALLLIAAAMATWRLNRRRPGRANRA